MRFTCIMGDLIMLILKGLISALESDADDSQHEGPMISLCLSSLNLSAW